MKVEKLYRMKLTTAPEITIQRKAGMRSSPRGEALRVGARGVAIGSGLRSRPASARGTAPGSEFGGGLSSAPGRALGIARDAAFGYAGHRAARRLLRGAAAPE